MNDRAITTFETVRQLAFTLPEVTEGTSYGTPAFHVHKKLLARLHEDGETLVIAIEQGEREFWILMNPITYFVTDHYVAYPYMLVRLASAQPGELETLLKQAWRLRAPKRLRERVEV
ncbi:MAG: MmcQ/YjbR family DNA-binding protein [Chloroflexi bacterium SZAS-1]|jgi:hypothetical protein|nr:MmcQ/YjbR family DNA-binding protein [Chloroflexi bacterium SZAS-1]HNP88719.1 MmcQ/YjbR family DNA-binding protein [Kouleothrix sp.]